MKKKKVIEFFSTIFPPLLPTFNRDCLGMQLIRKRENPQYEVRDGWRGEEGVETRAARNDKRLTSCLSLFLQYTLAFMGYGPEEENTVFELTYNWCVCVLMRE